jgi:hypothetical protein
MRPSVRWLAQRSLSMNPSIFSSRGLRKFGELEILASTHLLRVHFEDHRKHRASSLSACLPLGRDRRLMRAVEKRLRLAIVRVTA